MPDAVVVGAGVIGAAIALELQRDGRSVVVVDKGPAVGGGSTSSSAAIVRFSYSTPEGVLAAWEARHRWERWAEHLGPVDGPLARFHRVGMLQILPPDFDEDGLVGRYVDAGIPHEVLDAGALAARFPTLDAGRYFPPRLPDDDRFFADALGTVRAVWTPDAGFVDDPQLAAANLMDAARREGAQVRLRTEVVAVRTAGGRVAGVTLAGGEQLDAPVVVNAAGPWSGRLNRLAGADADMRVTTRTLRQEIHVAAAPPGFGVDDGGTAVGDLDLGSYFRPQPGGTVLVGGIEAECDPLVWDEDPDTAAPHPSVDVWQAQVYRLARRLPGLAVPHRPAGVASHYDVTPDWVPVYDRTGVDGFYVAIGTSGNQFKNAPLVGEIVAALVAACEAGHDHDRDPVAFPCRATGRVLDLGHYARNRAFARTSGTVSG